MIADDFDSIEDLEGASLSTSRLRQWMIVELARKADSVDFEQRLNQKADDVDVKDIMKRLAKIENDFAEQGKFFREPSKLLWRAFFSFSSCLTETAVVALCSLCSTVLTGAAVILGAFAFPQASEVAAIGCIGSMAATTAERKEPYCRSWRLWRWKYTRVAVTEGTEDLLCLANDVGIGR